MSTGTQILIGAAVAVVLFAAWMGVRRDRPVERRPVTPELDARLAELVADGKTIVAIKELRQATGMGLREAKEHVEGLTPRVRRRDNDRVGALLAEGKKIQAIKELRDQTGMGLREAKDYVDALIATGEPPAPRTGEVSEVSEATVALARQLVAGGKKIQAVKAVREDTGWGLKESKDFVDRL